MKLINLVDYPQLLYGASGAEIVARGAGDGALPLGQYGLVGAHGNAVRLARDPLGCNKLFFGWNAERDLVVANRAVNVWRQGVALNAIGACPPGHVLEISAAEVRDLGGGDIANLPPDPQLQPAGFGEHARLLLDETFSSMAREFSGCAFVVCLSGGLDSSAVASFASRHLPDVTAVSFTYLDEDDRQRHAAGGRVDELASASEDFHCAARVASALGMRLLPVVRARSAVADAIEPSVDLCQDWHDFNVHCATVNLFLAQDIRAAFPDRKVVVLTGDLMNEFVCDYAEERLDDTVYYRVPRIRLDKRRKHFVRGLDAGDREIGVFWAHGLTTCQPFARLAAHYLRLPASFLEQSDIKWTLNGSFLAPQVVPHVNRAKTRAQVGGKDQGTLGIYHRLGADDARLRRAWCAQFPGEAPETCDAFIQFGRYRSFRERLG